MEMRSPQEFDKQEMKSLTLFNLFRDYAKRIYKKQMERDEN